MKLTRHQLHAKVWEKPMTHLAREFGLSDVGLAKICRKYGIPIPERGYWAKVEAGYKVVKKPLPRKDYDPVIEIADREPITEAELAQKQKKKEQKAEKIANVGKLEVPAELNSPHSLTVKTLRYFDDIQKKLARQSRMRDPYSLDWSEQAPSADYGRYLCGVQNGFHLKVSLERLHRALCFLDTLVKALEERGFKIHHNAEVKNGKKFVEAIKDDEGIRFQLAEGYRQRMLTASELKVAKAKSSFASEYERLPSGMFTFTLAGREEWTEKKYVDGTKKIEERLPAIIAEFMDLVPRQKQTRINRAKAAEERQERERREWEIRWKRQKQQDQYEAAMAEANQLESLERLESYLQRLEAQYTAEQGSIETNVSEWLHVVRAIAKINNPLQKRVEYLQGLSNYEANQIDWMPE